MRIRQLCRAGGRPTDCPVVARRIDELDAMGNAMVAKLDRQDAGKSEKGRRASDRGAYSRFVRAISDAELTRFIKAALTADRFSWDIDEDAIARAALFGGQRVLLTNVPETTPADAVARYKAVTMRPNPLQRHRA